jgi:hypothetical protein
VLDDRRAASGLGVGRAGIPDVVGCQPTSMLALTVNATPNLDLGRTAAAAASYVSLMRVDDDTRATPALLRSLTVQP